jgi:hypothetical protein
MPVVTTAYATRAILAAAAFFVTRAKTGLDARRVYSAPTDRTSGAICDQRIMLNGFYSAKNYPEHLRRIRFKDRESGKTLVFLTNNTVLPALTIRARYKSRCVAAYQTQGLGICIMFSDAVTRALPRKFGHFTR